MNVQRMEKLVEHLEEQKASAEAARFNMNFWGVRFRESMLTDEDPTALEVPICKTQACLAGEAVLTAGIGTVDKVKGGIVGVDGYELPDIDEKAAEWLELSREEEGRLFYFPEWSEYGWPTKFVKAYKAAKTSVERLEVAIDRVKHFIRTDGEE